VRFAWTTVRLAIPFVFWVCFFFLPALDRTDPAPGWAVFTLLFWPSATPWILLLIFGQLLFLASLILHGFRIWVGALVAATGSGAIVFFFPTGPWYLAGNFCFCAAIAFVATASFIMRGLDRDDEKPLLPHQ